MSGMPCWGYELFRKKGLLYKLKVLFTVCNIYVRKSPFHFHVPAMGYNSQKNSFELFTTGSIASGFYLKGVINRPWSLKKLLEHEIQEEKRLFLTDWILSSILKIRSKVVLLTSSMILLRRSDSAWAILYFSLTLAFLFCLYCLATPPILSCNGVHRTNSNSQDDGLRTLEMYCVQGVPTWNQISPFLSVVTICTIITGTV